MIGQSLVWRVGIAQWRASLAAALACMVLAGGAAAQDALWDPIPGAIEEGEITVAAVPFVRAPQTFDARSSVSANAAYARLQYLQPVPQPPASAATRGDGAPRLAFNDTRGVLYMTNADGAQPRAYLDLREEDIAFTNAVFPNEAGFLGFAFHPQFASPSQPGYGKLYTAFTVTPESGVADYADAGAVQDTVVVEWSADDPQAPVFAGSAREVLRVGQFAGNHNIGTIAFNPTAAPDDADYGLLYICFGDGGSSDDPRDHGQGLATPLGSIARIDPLGGERGRAYGIPADNPFVGVGGAAAEIWAYGLRHPQQFSWDAGDPSGVGRGRMFLSDIGQGNIEEVNLGVAGANYGWRLREGGFATAHGVGAFNFRPVYPRPDEDPSPLAYPVAQYDHDEGYAVGGGYVYRGDRIPTLRGKYVFTEFVRGRVLTINALAARSGRAAPIEELRLAFDGEERDFASVAGFPNTYQFGEQRVDARIGIDHDGELYVLTKGNGWIYKLEPIPRTAPVHAHRLPFVLSAGHDGREGFVRVINLSGRAGEVTIDAIDDSGMRAEPVTLSLVAGQTRHFNSADLEDGNPGKGLSGRVGGGHGDWRLELTTTLVVEALAYMRTNLGFLTSMGEDAGPLGRRHEIVFFNPASNTSQRSVLRLVNPGASSATVTISARDDGGDAAPGGEVSVEVPPGAAVSLDAGQLEAGDAALTGALGDGRGKWRLNVAADADIQAVSLLYSPNGSIANLSAGGTRGASAGIGLFPAAGGALEGFARIISRSAEGGEVTIRAIDDAGVEHGPARLTLAAGAVRHFNSTDLENGNPAKGLAGGVGRGEGDWRLVLDTELDITPLAYIRTADGFVTTMHGLAPRADGEAAVRIFNPGSNRNQVSRLRVINTGEAAANVTITAIDDRGTRGEMDVSLTVPASGASTLDAQALEAGGERFNGRLGDGAGKWRLAVRADEPLAVMSLLRSPTGNLSNLSSVGVAPAPAGAP